MMPELSQKIDIVVVIATSGRDSLLRRTLDSLAQCSFPPNYLKTVVVENGPKAGAEEVVKDFVYIGCEYRYQQQANKSNALNSVLRELDDHHFVVFFDDDIRMSPAVLQAYAQAAEAYGDTCFYGGPIGVDYERSPEQYLLKYLPASAKGWEHKGSELLTPFDFLVCNWAVHHARLAELGGFDEKFGPTSTSVATGEEHDMMFRLSRNSIQPKYVSDARVWHYVPKERASLRWAFKRKYNNGIYVGINEKDQWSTSRLAKEFFMSVGGLAKGVMLLSKGRMTYHVFRMNLLRGICRGRNS